MEILQGRWKKTQITKEGYPPRGTSKVWRQCQAYDFKGEVEYLPFQFNLKDAPFTKEQQDQLLNLLYDNQQVFSLHNEDLGFCDKLAHTILTMAGRPVYLYHRTILWQLQGEMQDCLDTWLRQGIIQPSRSPYASQVVIVQKKTGEI